MKTEFKIDCRSFASLGLLTTKDKVAFHKARTDKIIIVTKDADFRELVLKEGPPPQILWITCRNTSNKNLQKIFKSSFEKALILLEAGEPLVEVRE